MAFEKAEKDLLSDDRIKKDAKRYIGVHYQSKDLLLDRFVIPVLLFFPFLTAAGNAQDAVQMLKEMATAGVGMAVVVTAVWVGMVAIASGVEKKAAKEAEVKGLER